MNSNTGITGLLVAIALVFSLQAHATNGYFTHGVGVKNKAMAGAGNASPEEAAATALNPAAAVVVGTTFEVGLGLFSPRRNYQSSASLANGNGGAFTIGPNNIHSENELFPVPYIGKIWQRGEDAAIAVNFYGRGGMNTEWKGGTATFDPDGPGPAGPTTFPGTYGAGTAGVDLSQAFLDLTYAWRTGDFNWGLSVVGAVQAIKIQGVSSFAPFTETFAKSGGTEFPTHLSNNGYDFSFGVGFKAGVIWDVNERWKLAAAYQSQTLMQKFEEYSDLFAESGGFDIPANARIGTSWIVNDALTLHLDVEHTWFNKVNAVGHAVDKIFRCPSIAGGDHFDDCLGGDHGAGFGWDNVTIYKLGGQWTLSATPDWTWRAGFSQTTHPISKSEALFNILAPAVVERHITFGGSRSLKGSREFSFGFMYAPKENVKGTNPFDPTQTILFEMHQFELEFAIRL